MAPRSPPSISTSAHEKSSNGVSFTSKSTKSLAVDNTDSDLCKIALETSSCEQAHGVENGSHYNNIIISIERNTVNAVNAVFLCYRYFNINFYSKWIFIERQRYAFH